MLGAAIAILGAVPAIAATPEASCEARKLRATGKAVGAAMACHAEAASGTPPAKECIQAALAKIDEPFAKAKARGGCEGTIGAAEARRLARRTARELAERPPPHDVSRKGVRAVVDLLARHITDPDPIGIWNTITDPDYGGALYPYLVVATRVRGGVKPTCGDGVRAAEEECDVADAAACYGSCRSDCTCGPTCGDGAINREGEQCDGGDDDACPGECTSSCTCPGDTCGNGTIDAGEYCDGGDLCGAPGEARACDACVPIDSDYDGPVSGHDICCDKSSCVPSQASVCHCGPMCLLPGDRQLGGIPCCSRASLGGHCL
jgi:hypothetical protein